MRLRHACAAFALLAAACTGESSDTWGYVATLGDDTTSVERITRTGSHVSGIAVGRSPRVVLRRWEADLATDGTVLRWTMDTRVANAPADEQHLHHELELSGGAVRLLRQAGSDTAGGTFAIERGVVVPWNAFLYATFDDLIRTATARADTGRIDIYFFEGWEEGRIGFARVRRRDDGTLGIRSSGLSGEGSAEVDELGRMVAYSGAGTTYKQEVRRVDDVPDLEALFERFAADERARGVATVLSARDTMRASVAGVNVAVDYSRPLARGRELVGALIPYDRVWRTGANAATQITFDAPVRLASVPLDAGTYTLWTLPSRDGVQLIINAQTGQWGTSYGPAHDIARVPMLVETPDSAVERFTIRVDDGPRVEDAAHAGDTARLVMEWGDFRWSVDLRRCENDCQGRGRG